MRREDVEALLADALDGGVQKLRSHQVEALCRRWIAVEDAPAGWVGGADMESAMQTVVMDKWPSSVRCGRAARVRIVPEQGES